MDKINHLDKSDYVIKPENKEIKEYLDNYLLSFIDKHPEIELLTFKREVCNDYTWYVSFEATFTANIEGYEGTKILNVKCSDSSDDGNVYNFLQEGFTSSEYFIINDKCKSCVCIKNKWYIIDGTNIINEFDNIAIKNGIEDKDNEIISKYFEHRLQRQELQHKLHLNLHKTIKNE